RCAIDETSLAAPRDSLEQSLGSRAGSARGAWYGALARLRRRIACPLYLPRPPYDSREPVDRAPLAPRGRRRASQAAFARPANSPRPAGLLPTCRSPSTTISGGLIRPATTCSI